MSGFLGGVQSAIGGVQSAVGSVTGLLGGGGGGGAPPDQRNRPISFAIEANGDITEAVTLALRPTDFTYTTTSRISVHHTLGGAFADNFGPGLPTINISGTTGWKGGADGNGEARWKALRSTYFDGWHKARKKALEEGRDPASVKLLYSDDLSGITAEVAPLNLTLRRNKASPLLIQYALSMVVLDQNRDQIKFLQAGEPAQEGAGGFLASLTRSINSIRDAIARVRGWINTNIVGPIRNFLRLATGVFSAVMGVVRQVRGLVQSVLAVPMMIASAGQNLFRTIAAVASLPAQIKGDVMSVAGAFSNIRCLLTRSRRSRLAYADYSPFYGASNCSSISGGRPLSPLAGANPFFFLPEAPSGILPLSMTDRGHASLATLATMDPVMAPMSLTALEPHLSTIQSDVALTPLQTSAEPRSELAQTSLTPAYNSTPLPTGLSGGHPIDWSVNTDGTRYGPG